MSHKEVNEQGIDIMGNKMGLTGELKVQYLWENILLPIRGSEGASSYCPFVAGNSIMPSLGKRTIDIGLLVFLILGTYTQIAPSLALGTNTFFDVKSRAVDLDYLAEMKVGYFTTL